MAANTLNIHELLQRYLNETEKSLFQPNLTLIYIFNSILSKCELNREPLSFLPRLQHQKLVLHLIHTENTGTSLLNRLLLLLPTAKGTRFKMITANVVKILDLVNTDEPILTGEGFLQYIECGACIGHFNTPDSINDLSRGVRLVEVVVRHLVPESSLLAW